MQLVDESRLCHLLVDRSGLRPYQGRRNGYAGFYAPVWKLDGEAKLRRGISIEFSGNWISLAWNRRNITASRAVLVEIAWPPVEPAEDWQILTTRFKRFRGPSNDAELAAIEADLRDADKTYQTGLGPFVRDLSLSWVEGKIQWLGQTVSATMQEDLPSDVPEQVALLENIVADQARIDREARRAIIEGLYELWVDNWRQDDLIVPPEEFAARMPVESICLHRSGEIQFWFEDANFFYGHGVLVHGTIADGFEPAEMHG